MKGNKKEILQDPEAQRLALISLRFKYAIKNFEHAVPVVADQLEQFKKAHEALIMEWASSSEAAKKQEKLMQAHTSEKTIGDTLAISNIMVVSTFMEQICHIAGQNTESLADLGPKIKGDVAWARGMRVASNYIRHSTEWQIPNIKVENYLGKIVIAKVGNLLEKIKDKRARRNIEVILDLDFKEEDFLEIGSSIFYRLADSLDLTNRKQTQEYFAGWVNAVKDKMIG
jgi:hypothetical protein